jgi:hypothetical protein
VLDKPNPLTMKEALIIFENTVKVFPVAIPGSTDELGMAPIEDRGVFHESALTFSPTMVHAYGVREANLIDLVIQTFEGSSCWNSKASLWSSIIMSDGRVSEIAAKVKESLEGGRKYPIQSNRCHPEATLF